MAMVVKNNMSAVRTLNTLNSNSSALQGSLAKVSSGMKINSAQDDASGYAISERMRVQIRSLDQANQNTQNGSSLMKTAEGAVSKTVEILKSLKEKAISAATDTNTDSDRVTIQKEIDQFIDQIDDNALVTFNGKYLVDGSKTQAGDKTFTAMTNQSLATGTAGGTALTALENRNNESLEIASTDYVTASFVKDGKTFTTKYQVGSTTLEDVFKNLNSLSNDAGIGKVFGGAHLKSSSMDTDTAKAIVGAATEEELFKAAANATDTTALSSAPGAMTNAKISDLADAIVALGTDTYAASIGVNTTSFESAESALKTAIAGVFTDVQSAAATVGITTANGAILPAGSKIKNFQYVAALYDETGSSGTAMSKVATASSNVAVAQTAVGALAVGGVTVDTDSDTFVAAIKNSIDNIAALNAKGTTTTSVATAAENSTKITESSTAMTASSGATTVASSNLSKTASTGMAGSLTGLTGATVDNYAKAYAINAILEGPLVNASSDVGLAASGDMTSTANGELGLTVTAKTGGLKGQVSGLAISITDSTGNVKKSANASLDAFSTTIFAANQSDDNALKFQVGATANLSITVGLADMRSEALGLKGSDGSKVSVATQSKANAAIATFDNALQKALDIQTTIGAVEARLDYTSSNLTTSSENVQAAESTIRDADMAKEMTNYTKNNVLLQAAQSMLAQANQNSSAVLSLLQ